MASKSAIYIDLNRAPQIPYCITFSQMAEDDLDALVRLEATNATDPWSRKAFLSSLLPGHVNWVAYDQQQLVGYICASTVMDELHILNLSVKPEYQGQGIATGLMMQLWQSVCHLHVRIVFLEVRQSNRKAQKLYRKLGFIQNGVRKGYYLGEQGVREDALLMSREY